MAFGEKQQKKRNKNKKETHSGKLDNCFDLDFIVVISTFQGDAMVVHYFSDKISK